MEKKERRRKKTAEVGGGGCLFSEVSFRVRKEEALHPV
jgi:hypothetical protein